MTLFSDEVAPWHDDHHNDTDDAGDNCDTD